MYVLHVDPDSVARKTVALACAELAWPVDSISSPKMAADYAAANEYDAIVVEAGPWDFKSLAGSRKAPIVVLSSVAAVDSIVSCLSAGADDYMTKPFDARELVARLTRLVQRRNGHPDSLLQFADITINISRREVTVAGAPVHLSPLELATLECLMRRPQHVVTRETLLRAWYGESRARPESKMVDVRVCHLRQKIAAASGGLHYIATLHGVGYRMTEPQKRKPLRRSPTETQTARALSF